MDNVKAVSDVVTVWIIARQKLKMLSSSEAPFMVKLDF